MALEPCPTKLRMLLDCDPTTGTLTWRERAAAWFPDGKRFRSASRASQFNSLSAGKEAFTARNAKGYHVGVILGKSLLAHRVIWALAYGEWPTDQIDHINGDPSDNRLTNLRLATHSQNMANRRPNANSKHSAFKGVCKALKTGHWTAQINTGGVQCHLGSFETEEDAARAYDAAAVSRYGEYARLNFPEERRAC